MKRSDLRAVVDDQRKVLDAAPVGLQRDALSTMPDVRSHAIVVSGIRRCGKSTLLHQYARRLAEPFCYLNFEDLRLSAFSVDDYRLLDAVIADTGATTILFDEVQSAPQWDRYVRRLLDAGMGVIITGSNAALLSRELGSVLTGRHLQRELFPFSWSEYLRFRGLEPGRESLDQYLTEGGFPEFLKSGTTEILRQLQEDILMRDIAVRFNVRDDRALSRLYLWLVSNAGNLMSPSKLTGVAGVKSPTTLLEYISHLESAWLIHTVLRFSWSLKARSLAPKKVYVADPGLIGVSSLSSSRDSGHILENVVFLELRRSTDRIFYLSEGGHECDFVIAPSSEGTECIQVCYELTADNEEREISGLRSAMDFFSVNTGVILTADQEDELTVDGKTILVVPVWQYFSVRH